MNCIASVVVTFNRKRLLEENISALLNQDGIDTDIIVVDNASTDGTRELIGNFKSIYPGRIFYINTGKNIGGSGGFCIGINEAIKRGYKYAWVMDDDTIPESGALKSLFTTLLLFSSVFLSSLPLSNLLVFLKNAFILSSKFICISSIKILTNIILY